MQTPEEKGLAMDVEKKDDAFGFGAVRRASAKERIQQIKPASPPELSGDLSRIDQIAANAGFVSREAGSAPVVADEEPASPGTAYGAYDMRYRGSRMQRAEPRIPINMRIPVSVGQAFQRFCEENRYSYPDGLEEIMKRAGLPVR